MKNKIIFTTAVMALIQSSSLFAQSAEESVNPFFMEHMFSKMLLIVSAGVVIVALLVILYLSNILFKMQQAEIMRQKGIEIAPAKQLASKPNIFKKIFQKAAGTVPLEKEEELLIDHDYDGIYELDNSLPPWWVWMFYLTIAWGVFHMVYYVFTDMGQDQIEEYETKMARAEEEVAMYLASKTDGVDETNVVRLTDEADLAKGKTIFTSLCAACHGQNGEGGVGPNMTDEYWIHGGDIKDLFRIVKYGVPEKGMISWKSQLSPVQMQQVSSYMLTLVGTNPPNGKEPQGELYKPEPSGDEEAAGSGSEG